MYKCKNNICREIFLFFFILSVSYSYPILTVFYLILCHHILSYRAVKEETLDVPTEWQEIEKEVDDHSIFSSFQITVNIIKSLFNISRLEFIQIHVETKFKSKSKQKNFRITIII